MDTIAPANEEAVGAWNGVLFDRFSQFRHLMVGALGPHGELAMKLNPPPPGARVLDIGCGFGDTTQDLAKLVGPEGHAVGIDAAERFIEAAKAEAAEAGAENVSFIAMDVEVAELEGGFDYAFARMGTMFFANPVNAMRRVRQAMNPGGLLNIVVWRQKLDNAAMYRAEEVVEQFVAHTDPEDTDELTCGPGPFSMANANTVSDQLLAAGFEDIGFRRSDITMLQGSDLDEAVALLMAIGPAGEVLRLAGDKAKQLEIEISAAIREMLSDYVAGDGKVWTPTSCWIITARVPAEN